MKKYYVPVEVKDEIKENYEKLEITFFVITTYQKKEKKGISKIIHRSSNFNLIIDLNIYSGIKINLIDFK